MEQQTVTIAKAGIHASLNARCSVLAAANPVYGQYDKSRRPQENIGLPDSLLSRFDLLFIVLDQMDPFIDRTLSEHVIKCHGYRRPGTIMEPESFTGSSLNSFLDDLNNVNDDNNHNEVGTPVWSRSNSGKGGSGGNNLNDGNNNEFDVLNKDFLRKYIHYAKLRFNPVLTQEASDKITDEFTLMRQQQANKKNLPVTARTLETMIRLSTAAARCRLSNDIELKDVEVAKELLNFVLFHEFGNSTNNNNSSSNNQSQQQQQGQSLQQPVQSSSSSSSSSNEGNKNEEERTEIEEERDIYSVAIEFAALKQGETLQNQEFASELVKYSKNLIKNDEIPDIIEYLTSTNKVRIIVPCWLSCFTNLFPFR
jgi:DNA replication licensing factor MCM3